MAKRTSAGERLAAIETELPHVWRHIEATNGAIDGLRAEMKTIRETLAKYAQTGLLLATAGLVHSVSAGSSAFAAEVLKVAFGLFTK